MDMVAGKSRSVLLVGSVPLDSSASVFEMVGTRLGELVKRIPDGETGVRKNWIEWQADVMKRAKGLQPGGTRPVPGGAPFQLYDVKPGGTTDFGSLGYAAEAIRSYQDFKTARAAGKFAAGTRFQVSLPTPIAVVLLFSEPGAVNTIWPAYEADLSREIDQIAAAIPHNELAIQWDVCIELVFVLEKPEIAKLFPLEALVGSIARASSHVPPDAELGLHLCYGDRGHKHMIEPKDTGLMVELTNNLVATIKHPIAWVHMPVPRERDDAAYFAPLKGLKLGKGTELYLGLVHRTDGVSGALRRIAAAKQAVAEFGVATECGFGRRPPETIPTLIDLHREVALSR
jgi:methionine synthase II (cobalamin-independent)